MILKHFYLLIFALISIKSTSQNTVSQQVAKFSISAPQLNTIKTIWVYLPINYQNSKNNFPVIYMHDAQNLFDDETSYAGEWQIDEFMDSLLINQSIIVGIENGNEKRIDELTPYKHEKYGGGNGNAYITFIKNTLKPHIDVTYRTMPEAKFTTILGSSLGGLISFYAALNYPETFGNAGVFSPSFWINPEIYDLLDSINIPESSRFYFVAGTDEGETMIPKLEEMISLLKSKGLKDHQLESHIIEGGEHNEKFWAAQFGKAYHWLNIH